MIEAVTVAAVAAAFAWLLDRKDRRHAQERERLHDPGQWLAVVENLCQRIQAPEHAIVEHQIANLPESPPAVPFDDDDAFHEAQGLSKEQVAQMLMEAERAAAQ